MYLLDKNVLDEIADATPHKNVEAWWSGVNETELFLSVTCVMEGRKGIEKIRDKKPAVAKEIETTLENMIETFQDRILSIDVDVADQWGRMAADKGGNHADTVMAATAASRGLTVVTRNTKDFKKRKVRIINPFKNPPEVFNP